VWQVLPSVGDKNAFTGICALSEYFPSSSFFPSLCIIWGQITAFQYQHHFIVYT